MAGKRAKSDFEPIPITKGAQRDKDIDTMAHRIVRPTLRRAACSTDKGRRSTVARRTGRPRALAAGFDPDSDMGRCCDQCQARGSASPSGSRVYRAHNVDQLYGYRERFEHKVRQAAGVLARLSPQTSWESNVAQANEVYHHLAEETVAGLFHDKREPLQRAG